jgi:hypothetical protein
MAVSVAADAVLNLTPSVAAAGAELVISTATGAGVAAAASTGASGFDAASAGASGFTAASAGATTSLMLGGGRSALSGTGTAAAISASDAAKALPA